MGVLAVPEVLDLPEVSVSFGGTIAGTARDEVAAAAENSSRVAAIAVS